MPAPTYKAEPIYVAPANGGEEDKSNAVALNLSNGHTHYVTEMTLDDAKEFIKEGRVALCHRHYQDEMFPMEVVLINFAQVVTAYPVNTVKDSVKLPSDTTL